MLQTPGHAKKTRDIKRHERHPKSCEAEPECGLAPTFMQPETKCLWKPVCQPRKCAKQNPADNNIMEMGNQKHAVVQQEVCRRHGQQHARHSADNKGHHKTQ